MLLAQISDLHVRPTGERYKDAVDSNRMFADAVEHLNRLDPRPDLVLITGDLVDEGLPAEYDSLRALLGGLELGTQRTDNFRNTGFFNNAATSLVVPYDQTVITTPVTFRQSATDANNHLKTNLGAAYLDG